MISEFVAPKLPPNRSLWYQQDGSTTHTAVINMAAFHCLSDVPWPPHLHSLTALFFFVDYLQSKVWSSCPLDLNALKQAIQEEIVNISFATLQEVMRSFSTHVHLCFQEGDSHQKETV